MNKEIIEQVKNNVVNVLGENLRVDIPLINKVEDVIEATLQSYIKAPDKIDFKLMHELVNSIPKKYKWLAKDTNGMWFCYKSKPCNERFSWIDDTGCKLYEGSTTHIDHLDWKDSLIKLKPYRLPWHAAPRWAVAAAYDSNNTWNWLEIDEVEPAEGEWMFTRYNVDNKYQQFFTNYKPKNWTHTLTLKPKELL